MQPSKVFMTIYQETIQLAQLDQINNFQECAYNTDKLMASFSKIFIGTENHWFRASSSRGVARNVFERRLDFGYHGWQRKFWDFRLVTIVTLDIVPVCVLFSYWQTKTQQSVSPHTTPTHLPPGTEKINKSTWGRLQAQAIPTCCTCSTITFILILEQPAIRVI